MLQSGVVPSRRTVRRMLEHVSTNTQSRPKFLRRHPTCATESLSFVRFRELRQRPHRRLAVPPSDGCQPSTSVPGPGPAVSSCRGVEPYAFHANGAVSFCVAFFVSRVVHTIALTAAGPRGGRTGSNTPVHPTPVPPAPPFPCSLGDPGQRRDGARPPAPPAPLAPPARRGGGAGFKWGEPEHWWRVAGSSRGVRGEGGVSQSRLLRRAALV